MTAFVLDVETTLYCDQGKFKGHSYHPENWAAYVGWTDPMGKVCTKYLLTKQDAEQWVFPQKVRDRPTILIGQNIKFDMAYARRHGWKFLDCTFTEFYRNTQVFDTQIAEYILTGQRSKMASLDDLAIKYGGNLKDDRLKTLFESGVSSEKIDPEIIVPYLEGDIENTLLVARKQRKLLLDHGQYPLFKEMMRFATFIFEMEYNGMKIDTALLEEVSLELQKNKEQTEQSYTQYLQNLYPEYPVDLLSPTSPQKVGAHLFGGELKNKEKRPVLDEDGNPVVYGKTSKKEGEIKTRYEQIPYEFKQMFMPEPTWQNSRGIATNDDILTAIARKYGEKEIVQKLLDSRGAAKEYGLYVQSDSGNALRQLIMRDGLVHPRFNLTKTHTGRTSCTDPNVQNINSDSIVRKCFVSRWGTKGKLVAIDYSQLEVIVQAYITRDKGFIADVLAGVCFHCKRASWASEVLLGRYVSYEEMYQKAVIEKIPEYVEARKAAKGVTFARAYGGGAASIAERVGIPVDVVKLMIYKEEEEYPGLKWWYEDVINILYNDMEYETHTVIMYDKQGNVTRQVKGGTGKFRSETGRIYCFPQVQKFNAKELGFSPTNVKNYPIQGFATGDIVPIGGAAIMDHLVSNNFYNNKVLPINYIHDEYLFDVHEDVLDIAVKELQEVAESVKQRLLDKFDIHFFLPLKTDVEISDNWY